MSKYLFQIQGGLGNQIEMFVPWYYVQENYKIDTAYIQVYDTDLQDKAAFFDVLCKHLGGRLLYASGERPSWWNDYAGVFACHSLAYPRADIPVMAHNDQSTRHQGMTEVEYYSQIVPKKDTERILSNVLPLDWRPIRGQDFTKNLKSYDLLICNGSVNSLNWIRKRYRRWNEVAEYFIDKGYKVGCVGNPDEYIYPADDLTDLDIYATMDSIYRCKTLVSNDTGLYHFAAAIGKPVVAVFTATDPTKNYDKRFHKSAKLINSRCERFPCQHGWKLSQDWANCNDWPCGEEAPTRIINAIKKTIDG